MSIESTGVARKATQQFTALLLRDNQYNDPRGTVSLKAMPYPVWGLGHMRMLWILTVTKRTTSGYSEGSECFPFYFLEEKKWGNHR